MSEEQSVNFDFKKYISIGVIVTGLSQFSMSVYYKNFGIDPNQYYETYEIIIGAYKGFIAVGIIIFFFSYVKFLEDTYTYKSSLSFIKIKAIKRPSHFIYSNLTIVALHFVTLLVAVFSYVSDLGSNLIWYFITPIFIFWILYGIKLSYLKYINKKSSKIARVIMSNLDMPLVGLALFILSATWITADIRADNTYLDNSKNGSEFIINTGEKIKITTKVKIIGRSKGYLLLLNLPNESIRIIKRSDITKEVLKNTDKTFQLLKF